MSDETPLLDALGGEDGIRRWVDGFYDRVATDPVLAPIFPPDLTLSREKQWAYFVQFFGGEALYTARWGKPFLRFKHRKAKIGVPERDAWMRHLLESLAAHLAEIGIPDAEAGHRIAAVEQRVRPIAEAMVNHHPDTQDAYYFNR